MVRDAVIEVITEPARFGSVEDDGVERRQQGGFFWRGGGRQWRFLELVVRAAFECGTIRFLESGNSTMDTFVLLIG